jgi:acetyl-CoA carboxylase biotin carboxylase subunit
MEVNARIQVEHPVSEEISGVDLIQMQLAVARGETLGLRQEDVPRQGHAIEVRILAEDPARSFAPSPGRITRWHRPLGPGIRLDSAMHEGALVPPFYDSMIAKLIARGRDRQEAIARLLRALDAFEVAGVKTNIDVLRAIARHPQFQQNSVHTRWLELELLPSLNSKLMGSSTDGTH